LRSPAIALKQITRKILEYSHIFRLYYEWILAPIITSMSLFVILK
jgi:hypothetical protein